jgi:hypothetical protein
VSQSTQRSRQDIAARTAALVLLAVVALAAPAAGQEQDAELAEAPAPAPADSAHAALAAAAADTALVPPPAPPAPDFFDTGVNGTVAVLMTPVFPGWGQLYSEGGWRSMIAFGAQWYFWSNMLARDRQAARYREHGMTHAPGTPVREQMDYFADEYWERMRDQAWWSLAVLLLVGFDSYVGAGLYGFDEEPVPVPVRFDEYFDTAAPEPIGSRGAPQLVLWQWSRTF